MTVIDPPPDVAPWNPAGVLYKLDPPPPDQVTYNGHLYTVRQQHTSQAGWPPTVWAPGISGWREVVAEGPAAWVQPTGQHDAYPLGAQVTHNGRTWTSTVAANVWPPGTGALWTDDGPV